jgi:FAD/FMN-containing dehydrogenase
MVTAKATDLVKTLESIVGEGYVSTSPIDRLVYGMGGQAGQERMIGTGEVIVLPATTEQVSRIVALADRNRIPIVPQGGGGQDTGSGIAMQGGIVMVMDRMDKILEINEVNMSVVVEAGCSIYKMMHELGKKGLRYPLGPIFGAGPQAGAQVGDNSIGCFSCKYGTQGDQVIGLEVVLPDGEVVTLGIGAYKEGHGHFWKYTGAGNPLSLFVESLGALGVVTKVAFRIIPAPKHLAYITYGWPMENLEGLARATYELQIHDAYEIQLFNDWVFYWDVHDGRFPKLPKTLISLIQDAYSADELKAKVKWSKEICEANKGIDLGNFTEKLYGPPGYTIWTNSIFTQDLIKRANQKQYVLGFHFPTLKLPEYYMMHHNLMKEYGLLNGKALPNWLSWAEPPANQAAYPMWSVNLDKEDSEKGKEIDKKYCEMLTKAGAVPYCMGPIFPHEALTRLGPQYELMKRIKKCIDPNNTMNPGQLY